MLTASAAVGPYCQPTSGTTEVNCVVCTGAVPVDCPGGMCRILRLRRSPPGSVENSQKPTVNCTHRRTDDVVCPVAAWVEKSLYPKIQRPQQDDHLRRT